MKPLKSIHATLEHCGVKIPGPTKLLIWSLGFVSVIAMTLRAIVPLIWEYRDNNMATQVQVILLDHNFRPPQLVLNLPRAKIRNKYTDDLMVLAASLFGNNGSCGPEAMEICENLKNASLDVWNDQDFNRTHFRMFYSDLTLAFIEKIFINPDPLDYFDDQKIHNEAINSALLNYITWLTWLDYNLSPLTITDQKFIFNLYPTVQFGKEFENFDSKYELLFNRMLKFRCTRVSYTELDFPHEYRDPVANNKTCTDLLLNSESPVYIGYGLTFALPETEIPAIKEYRFRISQQTQKHSLENSSLLADMGSDPLAMLSLADIGSLYATILNQATSPFIFQSPIESGKEGQKITVKYKVQMRARETRSSKISCLNGTNAATCFVQCTKLWVIEECKCVPFSMKKGLQYPNKEIPMCNVVSYAKCNITFLPKEINDQCMKKCKTPCDYTIYSWQISYENFYTSDPNVSEFNIKMVPLFDTFAEFTWIVKDTPEQFFSQLAGVGSFYLGFSGLSLISVIIWCMDTWKMFKKREAQKTGDGLSKNVGTVKWNVSHVGNEFSGKSFEEWLVRHEMKLQARWREDMEAIIYRNNGTLKI